MYPIEVKKSASPKKDAIKHFSVLKKSGLEIKNGAVVCMVKDLIPLDKDNWLVPVWLI